MFLALQTRNVDGWRGGQILGILKQDSQDVEFPFPALANGIQLLDAEIQGTRCFVGSGGGC